MPVRRAGMDIMWRRGEIARAALAAILCGGGVIAGCEAELGKSPLRTPPTRAVQSPENLSSPNHEVTGEATTAVPLVTVDLPAKPGDKPIVHSIAESLAAAQSRPATAPATRVAAEAETSLPVKLVQMAKPDDRCEVRTENGELVLLVTSASGIGDLTLARTGESWPAVIHVRLRYSADRAFSNLERFSALELLPEGRRLALRTEVVKPEGRADVMVPGFARSRQIAIAWVDAFR